MSTKGPRVVSKGHSLARGSSYQEETAENWNRPKHNHSKCPPYSNVTPFEVLDGGDPSKAPNSLLKNKAMAPIDESNLVANRLSPSSLDSCSGPHVDQASRVQKIVSLKDDGSEVLEPVENVFVTGNAAGAILYGHYTAGGVPVSSGMVGAYRIFKQLKSVTHVSKR